MGTGHTKLAGQAGNVISELTELVNQGWTQQQISRLAQMRGSYSRTGERLSKAPISFRPEEQDHLAFVQWLYHNGRIKK